MLIESVSTVRLTGTGLDVTIRCDMDADDISTPGSICVRARNIRGRQAVAGLFSPYLWTIRNV
jgi:hypothetical protein